MFNNVIVSTANATLSTRWTWEYNPTSGVLPHCSFFCCAVKEDIFLNESLFMEKEILDYFEKEILRITSDTHEAALRMYNAQNSETSRLIECELRHGDSITKEINITIPEKDRGQIYYVCVFDDEKYIPRVISAVNNDVVNVKKTPAGMFRKYHTIELIEPDRRRKVVETKCGKAYAYSVLPQGYDTFYYERDVNLDNIKIKYLSMLIGGNDGKIDR